MRSEFLYLGREDYPTEDDLYQAYRKVVEGLQGRPCVIRTLDIGADKQADYFNLDAEENPALGLRGIRICIRRPEVFRTQMRAIYRASAHGPVSVMFPMIASVWEVRRVRELCDQYRQELLNEGVAVGDVEHGIMIETPSAAIISDELAKEVDFFSIGTNDLTQYTYAADRRDSRMSGYFTGWPHAVGRLIDMVVAAAWSQELPVTICGVSATDPDTAERFIRQGVRGLCMEARSLMQIKAHLLELDLNEPPRFQR